MIFLHDSNGEDFLVLEENICCFYKNSGGNTKVRTMDKEYVLVEETMSEIIKLIEDAKKREAEATGYWQAIGYARGKLEQESIKNIVREGDTCVVCSGELPESHSRSAHYLVGSGYCSIKCYEG